MNESGKSKIILFLIADNDPVLSRVIKNKFAKENGWQSVITNTYKDAIDMVAKQAPDIILTEIIIKDDSGKTGFDIISELRKQDKHLPIIVFSDLGQEEDKKKAMDLGASYYFSKNEISLVDLIANVKEIIAKDI